MKQAYIVHVDHYVGMVIPSKVPTIRYTLYPKFMDFIQSIKEDFPDYKPVLVNNEGIKEKVMQRINLDKILMKKYKQRG